MKTTSDDSLKDDRMTVCMFVYNIFRPDIRVLKEAKSLLKNGYDVHIMALLDKNTIPYEQFNGIHVHRIKRNPFHYRFLIWIKHIFNLESNSERSAFANTHGGLLYHLTNNLKRLARPFKQLIAAILYSILVVILIELLISNKFSGYYADHKPLIYGAVILIVILRKRILNLVKRSHRYLKLTSRRLKQMPIHIAKKVLYPLHSHFCYYDYYKRCYKRIKLSPGNIYHAHDLNTLIIAWWCKKRLGGKLIYDSHELFTEQSSLTKKNKLFWTLIEKLLINKCDHVITVCDSIAGELQDRYSINPPTVLMNCPENNGFLQEKRNLIRKITGISQATPIILYQGGFSDNRGLRTLIISTRYLMHSKLVMMGWGKIEDELKSLVIDSGLEDRVCFIPPAPQNELLYWSGSADVGVIPYRAVGLNNYYSCPNKLFEYINAGLPVAGSAFPEISKIIDEWKLGKTFDPEDPESIGNAINSILDRDELLQKMRENSYHAAKVLNWQCESKKLVDLYQNLQ